VEDALSDQVDTVGLVLAGGGARGAYEVGALTALLPALEQRGELPQVIVGTSVGALNAAFLAAGAHLPVEQLVGDGRAVWSDIQFEQALEPIGSPRTVARLARYVGQFLRIPGARLDALLDPTPLSATIQRLVAFDRLERNVADGTLRAAAVVASSALTSRSVVFHRGGNPPSHDPKRGIDYVPAELDEQHVRASAAIPSVFPAVHVDSPQQARGWYFDGGTRLNTPIKPAIALGSERVIVLALNAIAPAPPQLAGEARPDALEGAAQLIQAVLVDPLVHDVRTLAMVNTLLAEVADQDPEASGKRRIPYILVAPQQHDAIGRLAARVFTEHYTELRDALRSRDLAFLGRLVAGGSDPIHGELLSYLFFAPEFTRELLELGRRDAERWLSQPHDDGPWEIGAPGPG